MFLNSTSGYCTFCADGEYYDDTFEQCRSWEGKWTGDWAYQTTCFECTNGEMLDTDTLTWVTECNSPKITIDDSQFTIGPICRGNNFYVDPESSSILEIGSRENPYRSMKPLTSEILNHHSNQDKEINIYLKENTMTYIEDQTNYFINISTISISSYSETSDSPAKATLMGTRIQQSGISKKAAFTILQNTDLKLDEIITESGINDHEIGQLLSESKTIYFDRCNFYLDNLNVIRQIIDLDKGIWFMYPIYAQHRLLRVTNCDFNVTGVVSITIDPIAFYMENVLIDNYGLTTAFSFDTQCNYPEAAITNSFYINNITVVENIPRTIFDSSYIVNIAGSSNITATNLHFQGKFHKVQ